MSQAKPQPTDPYTSAARLTWRGYDGVILHAEAVSSRNASVVYRCWYNVRDGRYGCDCPGYHSHHTCWHTDALLDGVCVFCETFKTLYRDPDEFLRDQVRLLHPRRTGRVTFGWLAARQLLRERQDSERPEAA